uniref:Hydroxysteroid (20-beta) dehydrogenase 2 n=1 Tax=Erpetoichthys calabaricus TaxID=27687 RepID=A0A8C4S3Y5_ERPCA
MQFCYYVSIDTAMGWCPARGLFPALHPVLTVLILLIAIYLIIISEKQHGQKTRIIQADFTEGYSIYEGIEEKLKGLEIGILGNIKNKVQWLKLIQVINCNILSVTQVNCNTLDLYCSSHRKKGLIINISSEMASHPHPMGNIYSSTKVFVNFFSRSLHAEYKGKGIIVQCVMPLLVSTNMTYNLNPNLLVKDPDSYAKEALSTVGYSTFTSGCLSHALQVREM